MNFFPKTLFWRIQLWYSLVISLVVCALLISFFQYEKSRMTLQVRQKLEQPIARSLPLFFGVSVRPKEVLRNPQKRSAQKKRSNREERRETFISSLEGEGVKVYASQGRAELYRSQEFPVQLQNLKFQKPIKGEGLEVKVAQDFAYVHRAFRGGRTLILAHDISFLREHLRRLSIWLFLIGVSVLVIALAMGGWLLTTALSPVVEMKKKAQKIAEGKLSERISVQNPESELGSLAADLNETFDHLEKSFQQQVRFSSDASHELRTPLAVILSKTQWALRKERDAEQYRKALETVSNASLRMKGLIGSLLDLSRFDSGQKKLNLEKVELINLLKENRDLVSSLAKEKEISISIHGSEVFAMVDQGLINQLFLNLLSNAVKYNREGGFIDIGVLENEQGISISIKDSGEGISEENLSRIFERFYQVDQARTTLESTGLGLAISKSIVDLHNGTLTVQSALGEGSEFTVIFPKSE